MRHHHHHHHSRGHREFARAAAYVRDPLFFDFYDRFTMRFHEMWHAIGRHRGGGGRHGGPGPFGAGGPFGGGFGGGFGGESDGFPRGRKFTSDDLQLLLLALIDEQPRHGYELIKALEARSNGFYAPSPGMVYPALTYLEELGYVTVELQGNRKRYSLAEPGRDYLAANRERADLMLAKLTHIARKMDSVRRAFAGEQGERGDDAQSEFGSWEPELTQARMALKHALLLRVNASPEEQRRIAAILARATAEIESKPRDGSAGGSNNGDAPTSEPV
jgi:DNA-binding PadR family transcriptional regulator